MTQSELIDLYAGRGQLQSDEFRQALAAPRRERTSSGAASGPSQEVGMTTEQRLNTILRFVHMHAPAMHRIDGDCVVAGDHMSDPDGDYCEIVELRTMREAREWLGY